MKGCNVTSHPPPSPKYATYKTCCKLMDLAIFSERPVVWSLLDGKEAWRNRSIKEILHSLTKVLCHTCSYWIEICLATNSNCDYTAIHQKLLFFGRCEATQATTIVIWQNYVWISFGPWIKTSEDVYQIEVNMTWKCDPYLRRVDTRTSD